MFCSKCGNQNGDNLSYCRKCGNELENLSFSPLKQNLTHKKDDGNLSNTNLKDPDELTGNGIGAVIVGDGFFMVAILLSTIQSPINSLLWLLLLIPAFFFFGKGFADVVHAKQIRRRLKQDELKNAPQIAELPPARVSFINSIQSFASGKLVAMPSITEKTTNNLE